VRRVWARSLLVMCLSGLALHACLCFLAIDGLTWLMRASRSGNLRVVKVLLLMGARPNQRSSLKGDSALFFAAANGRAEVAAVLLRSGADPNLVNTLGTTPLCAAGELSRVGASVFRVLIDGGADPNVGRWNALQCLVGRGEMLEKARALIDAGVVVDGKPGVGWPPIVEAARAGSDGVIALLLAHGATVDARGRDGRTSLIEAAARGCVDCVRRLVTAGAHSETLDANGTTALQTATAEQARRRGAAALPYQAIVDILRQLPSRPSL
jgi:ankyrin repeat protein